MVGGSIGSIGGNFQPKVWTSSIASQEVTISRWIIPGLEEYRFRQVCNFIIQIKC